MSGAAQLAALVVLSALILAAARRLWSRGAAHKQHCKWERDPFTTTALAAWVCRTCGEQAFSGDESQPKECKGKLRAGF